MRFGYYVSCEQTGAPVCRLFYSVCVCVARQGVSGSEGVRLEGGETQNKARRLSRWSARPRWHKFAVNRLRPNNLLRFLSRRRWRKGRPTFRLFGCRGSCRLCAAFMEGRVGGEVIFFFFVCPGVKRHQQADVHAAVTVTVEVAQLATAVHTRGSEWQPR